MTLYHNLWLASFTRLSFFLLASYSTKGFCPLLVCQRDSQSTYTYILHHIYSSLTMCTVNLYYNTCKQYRAGLMLSATLLSHLRYVTVSFGLRCESLGRPVTTSHGMTPQMYNNQVILCQSLKLDVLLVSSFQFAPQGCLSTNIE